MLLSATSDLKPLLFKLPLLLALLSCAQLLQAQVYSASFTDSQWAAQSGPFACSLNHKIPGFGNARFARNAGAAEFLELRHTRQAFPVGAVRIESMPPMWRSDVDPRVLGQVQSSGGEPLKVTTSLALIMGALEQGTNVVFSGTGISSAGTSLRVALEARNFGSAFGQYRQCIEGLIPYTFDQLSRTVINYTSNADDLSAAAKSQLDKIVRYTKADSRVLGILIDAHSDKLASPEAGEEATQRQAELVTRYLIDKGVDADTIATRWHGDKFPIANNTDKAGQAKNRRVTVRLENDTTRREMEKKIAAIKLAEQKAVEKAAAQSSASNSSPPSSLQQLEQMVEEQDLTSGKQPDAALMR